MPNQDRSIAQELLSHQTFLRRLAIDLVGSDADDLVQDVWQRALERPPHHGGQLRGWLARVARNLAANRWRGEARRVDREERWASEQPVSGDLEARHEWRKELIGALDSLSPSSRETILLRYFEGLAPREIARRQGTPLATVKTRLRRGLEQLREALDRRSGGDRGTWMSAVAALAAPVGSGVGTGTLVIGGMAMGTMAKVSAAVLVVAAGVYFVARTPRAETPPTTVAESQAADREFVDAPDPRTAAVRAAEPVRNPVVGRSSADTPTIAGTNVLRVILDGVDAEDVSKATVTLTGVDEQRSWPKEIRDSWPCRGRISEFDLDPFLERVERLEHLDLDELDIEIDHPHRMRQTIQVPLSHGVMQPNGKTVHEVRMQLVRPEFWPEFTLAVRDGQTRAHLDNIELRFASGAGAAFWGTNGKTFSLGDGLSSPIALMGGHNPHESVLTVAGLALRPAVGESPTLVEIGRRISRFGPERGVIVSARAPGYAWGSISLDVSKGERELLLEPGAALGVRLANVQLERYAELETRPMLCIYWIREDGGDQYVHFEPLDEVLVTEGLWLDGLLPGGYRVAVELGGGAWTEHPVLSREEISLAAGETRELTLTLAEPPAPPERATLGGVVSIPAFGDEEKVRLQLYYQPTQRFREPDLEFSLAELPRVGGALPTWSFRAEDLPVGMYRIQLLPFLKVWMVELTADGREGLELVLPELAEVLVETVDGRTGERVPLDEFHYRREEALPGQVQIDRSRADTVEPGRFRFWTVPGAISMWPRNQAHLGYGNHWMDLELLPGLQRVRFELPGIYTMRFEFREDGVTLPNGSHGLDVSRDIRAVGHDGRWTSGGLQTDMLVDVSAPGLYEIHFEGVTGDRYHPIPPRRVDVREGEPAEVIVELRRK